MNLNNQEYITERKTNLGGDHIIYKFPNGYGASCINAPMAHSYPFAWEIAVLKDGMITYETPLTTDVMIFDTVEETNEFLDKIKSL